MFRLQFGDQPMTNDEVADPIGRLQHEKAVSLAVVKPQAAALVISAQGRGHVGGGCPAEQ
jgi:hypothetical protein